MANNPLSGTPFDPFFGTVKSMKAGSQVATVVTSGASLDGPSSASSLLELQSQTAAIVISRMTTAQMYALQATAGMIVFSTNEALFYFFDGFDWIPFFGSPPDLGMETITFGAEVDPINGIIDDEGLDFIVEGLEIADVVIPAFEVDSDDHLLSITDGQIWRAVPTGTGGTIVQAVDHLTRMEADVTFLNARLGYAESVMVTTPLGISQSGAIVEYSNYTGTEIKSTMTSVTDLKDAIATKVSTDGISAPNEIAVFSDTKGLEIKSSGKTITQIEDEIAKKVSSTSTTSVIGDITVYANATGTEIKSSGVQLTTVEQNITNAQTKADTAQQEAQTAQSTANSAQSTASAAQSTASAAAASVADVWVQMAPFTPLGIPLLTSIGAVVTASALGLTALGVTVGTLGTNLTAVDAKAQDGLDIATYAVRYVKASCAVTTTVNLTATYSNGSSGVGATLTNSGALVSLSSLLPLGTDTSGRVLVKDQTDATQNGVYLISAMGDSSNTWQLTRDKDYDEASDIYAGVCISVRGNRAGIDSNTGTLWMLMSVVNAVGPDALVFRQVGGSGGGGGGTVSLMGDVVGSGNVGSFITTTIANKTIAISGAVTGSSQLGGTIASTFSPNSVFTGSSATIPVGTTGTRPTVLKKGMIRFNTSLP